ncbi:MAG: hypothetical protein ACRC9K_22290 [Afipia sp.]
MTRTPETGWMPDSEKSGHDTPPGEDFDINQQGKPMKTVIGVALLVVLALVLSRMHPAPHEIADPSVTTGQVTDMNAG